jgi:hypothetical protein
MAFHTQLPIYKVAYDLLSVATDLTANFPRPFRRLGDRVRDLCIETVMLIGRANAARQKAQHLTELLDRNGELELFLRLAVDKRFISRGQYAKAIELTQSVGRQANKWRGSYEPSPAA